ncbi:MAG: hypothetical protein KJO96_01985 [Winogradskyella sp.]|nr:hypothetical protein [Winogradskyella sp.]
MKKIHLVCLSLVMTSCYHVERNCTDYKTGEFKFYYSVGGEQKEGRFIRTNALNIDFYDGKIDSASVRWINDCEFILKKLSPQNKQDEKAIHMKILSTTDSSYVFEYKLAVKPINKAHNVEKGIAYKIN